MDTNGCYDLSRLPSDDLPWLLPDVESSTANEKFASMSNERAPMPRSADHCSNILDSDPALNGAEFMHMMEMLIEDSTSEAFPRKPTDKQQLQATTNTNLQFTANNEGAPASGVIDSCDLGALMALIDSDNNASSPDSQPPRPQPNEDVAFTYMQPGSVAEVPWQMPISSTFVPCVPVSWQQPEIMNSTSSMQQVQQSTQYTLMSGPGEPSVAQSSLLETMSRLAQLRSRTPWAGPPPTSQPVHRKRPGTTLTKQEAFDTTPAYTRTSAAPPSAVRPLPQRTQACSPAGASPSSQLSHDEALACRRSVLTKMLVAKQNARAIVKQLLSHGEEALRCEGVLSLVSGPSVPLSAVDQNLLYMATKAPLADTRSSLRELIEFVPRWMRGEQPTDRITRLRINVSIILDIMSLLAPERLHDLVSQPIADTVAVPCVRAHWQAVFNSLIRSLSQEQLAEMCVLYELFSSRVTGLIQQRTALTTKLLAAQNARMHGQHVPHGGRSARVLGAALPEAEGALQHQLGQVQRRIQSWLYLLRAVLFKRILTQLQLSSMMTSSYPYYPDCVAVLTAAVQSCNLHLLSGLPPTSDVLFDAGGCAGSGLGNMGGSPEDDVLARIRQQGDWA